MSERKDTNPKDGIGATKVPFHLLSPIAKAHWALAQFVGARKYQQWNWRAAGILLGEYLSALERHLEAYKGGETHDPADGTHHLGNIMACAAIILDAEAAGMVVDNRGPVVDFRPTWDYVQAQMKLTVERYSHIPQSPYTILNTTVVPLAKRETSK